MTQHRSRLASPVPLVDLKAQYKLIGKEVNAAMQSVLERSDFILGQELENFESDFAAYCGASHAVGCASGTDALILALRALNIGPGDEVIVPAMTFVATALAVSQTGAQPVLADVRPEDALMDPDCAAAAITDRTRAILLVHLYGQLAELTPFQALANRHGLAVVEDAAQAHGATDSDGHRAGSTGNLGCFSFYPGKNLGAYGDGGIVVCNDPQVADRLRLLRNCGSVKKYHHDVIGYNSRLDTLQAAILRVKLRHLDDWNNERRRIARAYDEALAGNPAVMRARITAGSNYHLYVVRVHERDAVLARLQQAGIAAGIHYPFALHELGAYKHLGYSPGAFPHAEAWARQCLSLPMYPELPDEVPAMVAALLRSSIGSDGKMGPLMSPVRD
jgi:dTDP-4-amino-4,6-dideoxygalactose transaminase